jgi:hypothetical protein
VFQFRFIIAKVMLATIRRRGDAAIGDKLRALQAAKPRAGLCRFQSRSTRPNRRACAEKQSSARLRHNPLRRLIVKPFECGYRVPVDDAA